MSDGKSKKALLINDLGPDATPEERMEAIQASANQFMKSLEEIGRPERERRAREVLYNFQGVCDEWARRDFWLMREGINLLTNEHPESRKYDDKFAQLWSFAQTCIGPGGSLFIVNPDAKALTKNALSEKYRVRPTDLLDWAKGKNLPIPKELTSAIYGEVYETPTSAATESQEQKKKTRRAAIRQFADLVYARALDIGMDWAEKRAPINATKEEFKDLFEHKMGVQPADRVKLETFKLDLKELGIQFARGVKKRSNNDLSKLFDA